MFRTAMMGNKMNLGAQIRSLFSRKSTVVAFLIVWAFALANMIGNLYSAYNVIYISQLIDPYKTSTLSSYSVFGYYFTEFFPILAILPTATVYMNDRDTGESVYLETRMGRKSYLMSQCIAVFLITFFVFMVPFIIEELVYAVIFPAEAVGDPSNFQFIKTVEDEGDCFLGQLWLYSKFLYGLCNILLLGLTAGILAVFNYACTTFSWMKFKIFAFFPVYLLLYLLSILGNLFPSGQTASYLLILRMFNYTQCNYLLFAMALAAALLFSGIKIFLKIKRDDFK